MLRQLATKAQQGFYKSLTGEWLPRNCTKARASQLISAAKNAPPRVAAWRVQRVGFWTTMGRTPGNTELPDFWEVSCDYTPRGPQFKTCEAAEAFARAAMAEGDTLEIGTGVRTIYCD